MAKANRVHSTPRRIASKINAATNIVRLDDHRPKPPKKVKQKSQYELYPMPFFNSNKLSTWDVEPTGNYSIDHETGRAFAIEFLKSCDGSCGWASLLGPIVTDMIEAGDTKNIGIVVGFMGLIGSALALAGSGSTRQLTTGRGHRSAPQTCEQLLKSIGDNAPTPDAAATKARKSCHRTVLLNSLKHEVSRSIGWRRCTA